MCGRTACTLAPDDVCRACGHQSKDGKWRQPRWQDPPGGQKYYTSYNVAPGSHTPVLVAKSHFESTEGTEECSSTVMETEESGSPQVESERLCEWVVQPMQWGLVPFWHSGDPKSVGYSMINARGDGILTKRSFKVPLEKGQRCVVLVDGYYEWQQTSDGKKQPYFIYFPHATADTLEQLNKDVEQQTTDVVYTGRRLLTLAAVFDIWRPKDGGASLYSYSIITVDSHKQSAWLHERMPAILDGEDAVKEWLDWGTVPLTKAVKLIKPQSCVHWHPVSTTVNSVKNKSEQCVKPVDLEEERKKSEGGSSSLMKAWLSQSKKPPSEEKKQPSKCVDQPSVVTSPAKKRAADELEDRNDDEIQGQEPLVEPASPGKKQKTDP